MRDSIFVSVATIGVLFVISPAGCENSAAAEPQLDGVALYLGAVRAQGSDPRVIRSGLIEGECVTTTQPPLEGEVEEALQKKISEEEQLLSQLTTDHKARWMVETGLKAIKSDPEFYRQWYRGRAESRIRFRMLFTGPVPGGAIRYEFQRYLPAKDEFDLPGVFIRRIKSMPDSAEHLFLESSAKMAILGSKMPYAPNPCDFGRLQGDQARMLTVSLLDRSTPGEYRLSDEAIEAFKRDIVKQQATNQIRPFEVIATDDYEGSQSHLLETRVLDKGDWVLTQRISVDPSRGFVCPLIQFFYRSGLPAKEWRSEQYEFLAESGLWYPLHYSETVFAEQAGKIVEKREYRIDRESLKFNFDVAESEFVVSLPTDATVLDSRTSKQVGYKLSQPLKIGFSDLADPSRWPGAVRTSVPPNALKALHPSSRSQMTWVILIANLLIVVVLVWVFWKRRSGKNLVLLMTMAQGLVSSGCSNVAVDSIVDAVRTKSDESLMFPGEIDLKTVRDSIEPVSVPITLQNHTQKSIHVVKTEATCSSCTAIEPNTFIVPPQGSTIVHAKLNTRGISQLSSSVTFHLDDGRSVGPVRIRGEVVRDVHLSDPFVVLRETQETARSSGVASLSVLDRPNLTFDIRPEVAGLQLMEESRSTQGRTTSVRLRIVADATARARLASAETTITLVASEQGLPPIEIRLTTEERRTTATQRPPLEPRSIAIGHIRRGESKSLVLAAASSEFWTSQQRLDYTGPDGTFTEFEAIQPGSSHRRFRLEIGPNAVTGFFRGVCRVDAPDGIIHTVEVMGVVD